MLMCFDVNERNVPLRVPDGPPCSCRRYKKSKVLIFHGHLTLHSRHDLDMQKIVDTKAIQALVKANSSAPQCNCNWSLLNSIFFRFQIFVLLSFEINNLQSIYAFYFLNNAKRKSCRF